MTKENERRLMRLLHGELPAAEARHLERELEGDAELRAAYRRLAETWERLELPASEVPAGFSAGVMAAAHELRQTGLRDGELSWSLAPAWARTGAAAALATGLLLGVVFGGGVGVPGPGAPAAAGGEEVLLAEADVDADSLPLSLAEVYWLALEEGGDLEAGDGGESVQ